MTTLTNRCEMGKVTVGIIDDDKLFSTLVCKQLALSDIRIMFNAQDGNWGIAQLKSMSMLPEVVIVDLEMPIMNGFEVVRYLKQTWPFLQIIAHSSLTNDAVHKMIIDDGADMFVLKQPNAFKLVDAIKKLSSLKAL
ncbi:response regulator [Mucilaginibacter phyllosphaerae]